MSELGGSFITVLNLGAFMMVWKQAGDLGWETGASMNSRFSGVFCF